MERLSSSRKQIHNKHASRGKTCCFFPLKIKINSRFKNCMAIGDTNTNPFGLNPQLPCMSTRRRKVMHFLALRSPGQRSTGKSYPETYRRNTRLSRWVDIRHLVAQGDHFSRLSQIRMIFGHVTPLFELFTTMTNVVQSWSGPNRRLNALLQDKRFYFFYLNGKFRNHSSYLSGAIAQVGRPFSFTH